MTTPVIIGWSACIKRNDSGYGIEGKAQSARGMALEHSDISELSAFTLCAMLYAAQSATISVCHHASPCEPQGEADGPCRLSAGSHGGLPYWFIGLISSRSDSRID
jgi:hypothetical protein